jgi:hypothetical protein
MAADLRDQTDEDGAEAREKRPEARSTYRTLDEQEGRLSPAEERFERRRRTVGVTVMAKLVGLA